MSDQSNAGGEPASRPAFQPSARAEMAKKAKATKEAKTANQLMSWPSMKGYVEAAAGHKASDVFGLNSDEAVLAFDGNNDTEEEEAFPYQAPQIPAAPAIANRSSTSMASSTASSFLRSTLFRFGTTSNFHRISLFFECPKRFYGRQDSITPLLLPLYQAASADIDAFVKAVTTYHLAKKHTRTLMDRQERLNARQAARELHDYEKMRAKERWRDAFLKAQEKAMCQYLAARSDKVRTFLRNGGDPQAVYRRKYSGILYGTRFEESFLNNGGDPGDAFLKAQEEAMHQYLAARSDKVRTFLRNGGDPQAVYRHNYSGILYGTRFEEYERCLYLPQLKKNISTIKQCSTSL
ncbi:MAG: hypothetical protein L6R40_004740 [Gallowayella cf. fulva]|nr:MAG: hypothetical protein L6R40_004740 [Xanthomendoza cf. fulva]